jgi:hypothetical protein
MTAAADLELELKGLMLARTILEWRGIGEQDLVRYREEIDRVRARLQATEVAEGGGARSVAA